MNTNELTGPALDWAVTKAYQPAGHFHPAVHRYSTDWEQAEPIIVSQGIEVEFLPGAGDAGADTWVATRSERPVAEAQGDTPLIAAMRCFVASRFGNTIDIPEGLK